MDDVLGSGMPWITTGNSFIGNLNSLTSINLSVGPSGLGGSGMTLNAPSGADGYPSGPAFSELRTGMTIKDVFSVFGFACKHTAIHMWAVVFHPLSRYNEWGAWLLRDPATGRYSFEIRRGEGVHVDLHPKPQNWGNVIAFIHTHPNGAFPPFANAPAGFEFFTISDANVARNVGVPGFLVTPLGYIYKVVPGPPIMGNPLQTIPKNHPVVSRFADSIFRR